MKATVWRASQEGLPVVIVNPGIILGETDYNHGSGQFFEKTNRNQPFYVSGGSGFVDVRDVVCFMEQLMDSDLVNERYILVAENKTFKSILKSIAET